MRIQLRKFGICLALAIVSSAFLAAAASAATSAYVDAYGQLKVTAATGVANNINVYPSGVGAAEVSDSSDVVSPGSGCTAIDPNSVFCVGVLSTITVTAGDGDDFISGKWLTNSFYARGDAGDDQLVGSDTASNTLVGNQGNDTLTGGDAGDSIDGGDGVDSISALDSPDMIWGGSGDDTISGGESSDTIDGGDGVDTINGDGDDDVLSGGNDNDTLNGGEGNDSLRGGAGADIQNGNGGVDTSTYSERSATVWVYIDNLGNDGGSGEGDNVKTDVENLTGGAGSDSLRGTMAGFSTSNVLDGGAGNDSLYGYNGNDTLIGGAGSDKSFGGNGNDSVQIKDGANDTTNCESGSDTVIADLLPLDSTVSNCESVSRS